MRVLVVASHSDDEVLGAGGAISCHVAAGDEVHILIMADCRTARDPSRMPQIHPGALGAAGVLGAKLSFAGCRGMELDAPPEVRLTRIVEPSIADLRPSVVYTHHAHDLNSDHRAVSRAVMVATRPFGAWQPDRVLHFEVPSSTGWETPSAFAPNVFAELSEEHLAKKLEAMACYAEEMRLAPHPRSLEALRARASYWGQQAGCRYAEPFMLMREVMR